MARPLRKPAPPAPPPVREFARSAGTHAPAAALQTAAAAALGARGIGAAPLPDNQHDDYAQIDPALATVDAPEAPPAPASGLGYAGFSPAQRAAFLRWLDHPHHEAPAAFRRLYLAQVECTLLDALLAAAPGETEQRLDHATAVLRAFDAWPHWRADPQRTRTLLLALRLRAHGAALAEWITGGAPHPTLLGVALGQQALLGAPLTAGEAVALAQAWGLAGETGLPAQSIVALRLDSLAHSLGADPLAAALAATADSERAPRLWRCAHRDLRLLLPQPDLRPALEPLLAEMLEESAASLPGAPGAAPADAADDVADSADNADNGAADERPAWYVVLEFAHSRSDFFEFALQRAQKLPGYSVLMDEQRHMIHRVLFRKGEMRRFWPLWDYVQSWAGTRVYINGVEMEKWKIWPYSQFMK